MNLALQQLTRLPRAIGMVATITLLLVLSSGHELVEENLNEVVTVEVEMLADRSEKQELRSSRERTPNVHLTRPTDDTRINSTFPVLAVETERNKMNGCGSHLLI